MTRRSTLFLAWLGWVTFVVYGSLVPLDFTAMPLEQAVARFKNIPFLSLGIDSRADWVANGVLYAPLGLLSARLLKTLLPPLPYAAVIALAWAGCVALAVGMEFTQLFFPPRTVSQNDLMAEAIGSAVGVLLAPLLAGWMQRLGAGWFTGGGVLLRRLLEAYAVGYLLLCFFPYDLLLSWAEVQGKWAGAMWGWVLAPNARGALFALLQWLVETGLMLPMGVLLAHRAAPVSLRRAAAVGAVLGLLIELGQFFLASGVSQGASVLSRLLGVMLGVRLGVILGVRLGAAQAPALGDDGVPALQAVKAVKAVQEVRAVLARNAGWLMLLFLSVLLFVNGWFRAPWHGLDGAGAVWRDLRLLPFYYHYWTTEAIALFSLGSVALMYLPAVVLGWSRGWRRGWILLGVLLLALVVEVSKLFIVGLRPDPSNLLIATAAAAVALTLLGLTARDVGQGPGIGIGTGFSAGSSAGADPRPGPRPGCHATATWRWPWLALPVVLVGAVVWTAAFPVFPAMRLALLALWAACALAVWCRPVLALALIPAALPVLDLAPWSGRFFWDEFDVLQAVCITIALGRTAPPAGQPRRLRVLTVAFALLALSLAVATVRGVLPWQGIELNSFSSYYSPFNALRIAKGALWAWLFVLLWQRLAALGDARPRMLGAGMAVGLALTVAFVLWERAQAVSLLDFNADFRVSGPMSAMHKGGAYLECWLAVAAAFVMAWVVRTPHGLGRAAGLALLAATGCAVMVTFSRSGYAALLVALVLSAASAAASGKGKGKGKGTGRWGLAGLALLLVMAVAVPVLTGGFARERLARSAGDLAVRQAHWADALQLRDRDVATHALGMGLGTFPVSHFWRSSEPQRAASYGLARDGDNTYLRLGGGATLYIEQVLPRLPADELVLAMDLRATNAPAALTVMVCRKWGLTSQDCVSGRATAPQPPAAAGAWQPVELRLNLAPLRATGAGLHKPVKLSLLTPDGDGRVDVDRLRLSAAPGSVIGTETGAGSGATLLANGDFSAGMERWFFATDVKPPWNIDSLPVAVLFDQGWLGVVAWGLVVVMALGRGLRLGWRGQALVPAALAGAVALLASGTLNTLIDAPRFLALLLVLLWLAAAPTRQEQRSPAPGPEPGSVPGQQAAA